MARAIRTLFLLLFLVLFAAVAWVAIRGAQARGHLEDAADGVTLLQRQMRQLEVDQARATLGEIQDHTEEARDLTSDPVWNTMARFPWGGQNLAAVGTATESVDELANDGLPALVEAGAGVQAFQAKLAAGELDASPLQQMAANVAVLDRALERTRDDIDSIDRRYVVRAISSALDELSRSLDVAGAVRDDLKAKSEQGAGG